MMADYEPPLLPPPFLSEGQVDNLAYQGHIPITLPIALAEDYRVLFSQIEKFFSNAEEEKVAQYPAGHGTELGYYHVKDEKEYLTLRNASKATDLEHAARQTWHDTVALLVRVISDLSWALGVNPQAWEPTLDGCREMPHDFDVTSKTLMRLFRYEPNTGTAASHTDNGLLTLCMGKGKGLQLWEKSSDGPGRWIDAEGPTLLAGVTMQALSSGAVAAGKHRVVGNPEGRNSIVFALRACTKHQLDLNTFGREGSISLAALHAEIDAIKVNVNAHKDIRDRKWAAKRTKATQT